jgi:hypothetical protein
MVKLKQEKTSTNINGSSGITSSSICKALQLQSLTSITTDLELLRANNEGKIPYGTTSRLVLEYNDSFPWLNIDIVSKLLHLPLLLILVHHCNIGD